MNAFLFIFQVCCFYGTTNQISSWLSGRAEGLEIWGGQYLCGGHNLFPLVEIGLTYVPKSGGDKAPQHLQGRQACILKESLKNEKPVKPLVLA